MELSSLSPQPHEGMLPRLEKQESECQVFLENGVVYNLRHKNKHWEIVLGNEIFELLGFATWPALPTEKDQIAEYMNSKYEVRKDPQVGRYLLLANEGLNKRVIASKIIKVE